MVLEVLQSIKPSARKSRPYFVYRLVFPNDCIYIGITNQRNGVEDRYHGHANSAMRGDDGFVQRAIRKYGSENVKRETLCFGLTRAEAFDKEVEMIAITHQAVGARLYNVTKGGDGVRVLDPEKEAARIASSTKTLQSLKWRRKQSIRCKRAYLQPGTLEKHVDGLKRAWADPVKHKIWADACRKATTTPEYRIQQSKITKEIGSRPEVKAKLSTAQIALWADPVERAKRIMGLRKTQATSQYHTNLSIAQKKRWAKPDSKEKQSKRMKVICTTSTYRARLSKVLKKKWLEPEYKARRAKQIKKTAASPVFRAKVSKAVKKWWAARKAMQQNKVEI